MRGFVASPPNDRLLRFARAELGRRGGRGKALDVGCGAARNLLPLAVDGWHVMGVDVSRPMLEAAASRIEQDGSGRVHLAEAAMDRLPAGSATFDCVIAHGVWNLASSDGEFRRAVAEAARVIVPGGALFVFTFSRNTLAPLARPVPGEQYVFTEFAGEAQCFVTAEQLLSELAVAGFTPDADLPLVEHNRPLQSSVVMRAGPVIYEGAFRKREQKHGEAT